MWKGFLSFGLVTVPVNLYNALESREEIHFNLLHAEDQGRIRNKRFCERCDQEVAWGDIVKGYAFAKDEYVVVTDEDFEKADVKRSSTIDILDFVGADEVDPKLVERPCWLEPQKGSARPYALLREALRESGKVGIAKVVLRTREHLAMVRPDGDALLLEILRFSDELRSAEDLELPAKKEARERELSLAKRLVDEMTVEFDPARYTDDYKSKLKEILAEKVEGREPEARGEAPKATRIVDLTAVLERSLGKKPAAEKKPRAKARKRKKAA